MDKLVPLAAHLTPLPRAEPAERVPPPADRAEARASGERRPPPPPRREVRSEPAPSSPEEIARARAEIATVLARFGREAPVRPSPDRDPSVPGRFLDIRV